MIARMVEIFRALLCRFFGSGTVSYIGDNMNLQHIQVSKDGCWNSSKLIEGLLVPRPRRKRYNYQVITITNRELRKVGITFQVS